MQMSNTRQSWKAGDLAANTCRHCGKIVQTRYERRSLQMRGTRLTIPDVLVDVCTECDAPISYAPESFAQLRAAGVPG